MPDPLGPLSGLDAAVRWYLCVAAITWALAPLVYWLCRALIDRGAAITRPVALLVAIYPGWLLASIGATAFGVRAIAIAVFIGGALGWGRVIASRAVNASWIKSLAGVEVASLLIFAAYLWLRGYTPEILGTEKPMDVAFLASSSRSVVMPPPDPWFAGEPINYYYLGYLIHGSVARIADVPPAMAFNLALATIFSMTAVAAFGVAWNATRPWFSTRASAATGVLAACFTTFAGNLYAPWRLLLNAPQTIGAWWWDSEVGIGWRSSRIVCDGPRAGNLCQPPSTETINEFPFFSFLLGDLHPHVMALPYTLVAIALAWNFACRGTYGSGNAGYAWLVRFAMSGGIVGSLYAMNSWDLPAFLGLLLLAAWGLRPSPSRLHELLLIGGSAFVVWLPFILAYDAPTNGSLADLPSWVAAAPVIPGLISSIALHIGEHTSVSEYLTMFGVPYVAGLALLGIEVAQTEAVERRNAIRLLGLAAAMTVIPAVLFSVPILPLCGIPLTLAIAQLVRDRALSPSAFALTAYSAAWSLSMVVEFFYLRDVFDDRMNTLFKVYYQVWTLYALGAAVAIALVWSAADCRAWVRASIAAATGVAVVAGLAYPMVASYQWTAGFEDWKGLDGLAYAEEQDRDDVQAIRWLAAHAEPGDVVLEAAGCSYRPFGRLPFNRVSGFTGVPTVIGWGDNHQRQWRAGQPALLSQIAQRQADVAEMYADPASPLFDMYGVRWLVVGSHERETWQADCPTAGPYQGVGAEGYPENGWEEAFRSGETRIFRRGGA